MICLCFFKKAVCLIYQEVQNEKKKEPYSIIFENSKNQPVL
jgi:hypothetical protein